MEIGRNHVPIIITSISNIAVLMSHNVICFGYFMSMSHVNKKAPTIFSLHPFLIPGFHQAYLLFYKKYFINLFCSDLTDYCKKKWIFKIKQIFSFNLLLFCVYVFLRAPFHSSATLKLRIVSCLYTCITSYWPIYGITKHMV